MFLFGYHHGHDLEIHLQSWMDAAAQLRHANLYPRWATEANYGFGEPRFIFYPPVSWMLGAVLGLLLPWRIVPAVFIWLTTILAALAMRKFAADWLPPRVALMAGILYAFNPYFVLTAYTRCAFGELLASALFPFLLWGALRIQRDPRKSVGIIAVSIATIWLANLPAGVIATYSLLCVLVVLALVQRSIRPVLYGGIAAVMGLGLAAFSLLPAAWEQKWVNIAAVSARSFLFSSNFLFSKVAAPEAYEFNHRLSPLAVLLILAAIVSAIAARQLRKRLPTLWWSLAVLCGISGLLMFRVSSPVWHIVPELRYLQFPWRWLFPLCASTVLLIALAIGESKKARFAWAAVAFIVLVLDASIVHTKQWFPHSVEAIAERFQSGAGYAGLREYAPLTKRDALPANAPVVFIPDQETQGWHAIQVESWSAEEKRILANLVRPTAVDLKLLAYPAWQADVNGKPVALQTNPRTGQVTVWLPVGASRTEIIFAQTRDRTVGIVISALSGAALLAFWKLSAAKRKRPSRQSRPEDVAPARAA